MLYQHKITGGIVEKVSQHGEGVSMVINANDEAEYVNDDDLIPCVGATSEKIKTEERLKAHLKSTGSFDCAREFTLVLEIHRRYSRRDDFALFRNIAL